MLVLFLKGDLNLKKLLVMQMLTVHYSCRFMYIYKDIYENAFLSISCSDERNISEFFQK